MRFVELTTSYRQLFGLLMVRRLGLCVLSRERSMTRGQLPVPGSTSTNIQLVWTQFCANSHVDHGGVPLAGLDLNRPFSYANLINAPDGGLTIYLVAPPDPAESLLWRKLNCNAPGPHQGAARTPLGRPPPSAALQALDYDGIKAGAPQTLQRIHASDFEALFAALTPPGR